MRRQLGRKRGGDESRWQWEEVEGGGVSATGKGEVAVWRGEQMAAGQGKSSGDGDEVEGGERMAGFGMFPLIARTRSKEKGGEAYAAAQRDGMARN